MTEWKLARVCVCVCVCVCQQHSNTTPHPHRHFDAMTRSHENEFRHPFMYAVEVFAADWTSGGANDLDCLLHPSCDNVDDDVHNTTGRS